jgi:hypothetical protein
MRVVVDLPDHPVTVQGLYLPTAVVRHGLWGIHDVKYQLSREQRRVMATQYYEGDQNIYINIHKWPPENIIAQLAEDIWTKMGELSKEGAT